MKALVQRVGKASVSVDGELVSSIGRGLCVLVGLRKDDTREQAKLMAKKLLAIRAFEEPGTDRRWAKGAQDLGLEILCVSQFTLGHGMKGNKPDFSSAMGGDEAKALYGFFLDELRSKYDPEKVKDGRFGAMMTVDISNDGPVTLEVEYRANEEAN